MLVDDAVTTELARLAAPGATVKEGIVLSTEEPLIVAIRFLTVPAAVAVNTAV